MIPLHATCLLVLAAHVAATDNQMDVRADLDRFYAERLRQPFVELPGEPERKPGPPPWAAPIKKLESADAADRRAAAGYLRELIALSLADERSGKAPWRNTPYWGGGAETPARDLRHAVADELPRAKPSAELLPVLRWYLENEPADRFLGPVVEALGKLDGEAADAVRVGAATGPHPNAVVVAAALRQLVVRKKPLPADVLASLCHHHRTAVRDAARTLNAALGGPDPGPFDAAKAVRGGPVAKVMDRVLELMPDLPGLKAEPVSVTVRYLDGKVERRKEEQFGWLVRREGGVVEVYTPHGRTWSTRDQEKTKVSVGEPTADGKGMSFREVETVATVTVAAADVVGLVKDVAVTRGKGAAGEKLSERGGLTGQFRGSGATLLEADIGASRLITSCGPRA